MNFVTCDIKLTLYAQIAPDVRERNLPIIFVVFFASDFKVRSDLSQHLEPRLLHGHNEPFHVCPSTQVIHGMSSNLSFENFPSDVLLEIAICLQLIDVLTFLSVCSSFQKLSGSRYLWISLLERIQRHRPLACPVGSDITKLSLNSLRRIALHTHRVQKNWNDEAPRILRAVKSIPYLHPSGIAAGSEPAAILAAVPGTSLIILYTQEYGQKLICCDVDGMVPTSSFHVGKIARRAHYNEFGRHLIALVIMNGLNDISLCVFSVTYGKGRSTNFQQVFSVPLEVLCESLFICKDVIGIVPYPNDDTALSIRAFNFITNTCVNISARVGYPVQNSAYVFCSVCDDTPYIIILDENFYQIHRFPPEVLPYASVFDSGDSIQVDLPHVAEISRDGLEDSIYLEMAELQWSPMGLYGIFVQYPREYSTSAETLVRFWPQDSLSSGKYGSMNFDGRVGSYAESRFSPWLAASSPSGTYAVVALHGTNDITTDPDGLCLLHFVPDSYRVECRPLRLPFFIDLERAYAIAIDERCGVIYISDVSGYLFAVSYA